MNWLTPHNEPCPRTEDEREAHEPHEWDGDLGDEGYECWGYPVPDVQPARFRLTGETETP